MTIHRATRRSDDRASAALRDAYTPHAGPDGVVMNASGWLVTAQR
jgi:hypothetical protein